MVNHLYNINNKVLIIGVTLLISFGWLMYQSGLLLLWIEDEQYGHGLMVLGLLGYVLYRRRDTLEVTSSHSSWFSIFLSSLALLIFIIGAASGISVVRMYSIWVFMLAIVFAIGGWTLFRKLIVPMFIIFLLIPLPAPLGPSLTANLQLISSKLGVWVIRLFGGIVYLEGNVIEMGNVKLLVAEACAGLRYLFPLMSMGAIAGYIMHAPLWMRWLIFLATIPVTVFMNSFRIGVTGLLSEKWGTSHTEGFLHFFEGWVVFVAALIVLVLIAWVLIKFIPGKPSLWRVFAVENKPGASLSPVQADSINWIAKNTIIYMIVALVLAATSSTYLATRSQAVIAHKPLSSFPLVLGEWRANESSLPTSVVAVAGASEYYYSDFRSSKNEKINVYISYYKSQRYGQIPHSPKVCIPGDGWVIKAVTPVVLNDRNGKPFTANRLVTTKQGSTVIAYYWLKQGRKMYSKEALARLDLIRISLLENRTDGALIRLVTNLTPGESEHDADKRLRKLSQNLVSVLSDFVPD